MLPYIICKLSFPPPARRAESSPDERAPGRGRPPPDPGARRAQGLEADRDRALQRLLSLRGAPSPRAGIRGLVRAGPGGTEADDGGRARTRPRLPLPLLPRPRAVELPGHLRRAAALAAAQDPVVPGLPRPAARAPPVPAQLQVPRPGPLRAPAEPHLHPLPGE